MAFIYIPGNVSTWKHGGAFLQRSPCSNRPWLKECAEEGTSTTTTTTTATAPSADCGKTQRASTRRRERFHLGCVTEMWISLLALSEVTRWQSSESRAPPEEFGRPPGGPWLILPRLLLFVSSDDVSEQQQQQPTSCSKVSAVHVAFKDIDVDEGSGSRIPSRGRRAGNRNLDSSRPLGGAVFLAHMHEIAPKSSTHF